MTREASEILDAALALTHAARVELAALLADSVGDGASPEQTQAVWLAEAKLGLKPTSAASWRPSTTTT